MSDRFGDTTDCALRTIKRKNDTIEELKAYIKRLEGAITVAQDWIDCELSEGFNAVLDTRPEGLD